MHVAVVTRAAIHPWPPPNSMYQQVPVSSVATTRALAPSCSEPITPWLVPGALRTLAFTLALTVGWQAVAVGAWVEVAVAVGEEVAEG
jgi:hypothetical protein